MLAPEDRGQTQLMPAPSFLVPSSSIILLKPDLMKKVGLKPLTATDPPYIKYDDDDIAFNSLRTNHDLFNGGCSAGLLYPDIIQRSRAYGRP